MPWRLLNNQEIKTATQSMCQIACALQFAADAVEDVLQLINVVRLGQRKRGGADVLKQDVEGLLFQYDQGLLAATDAVSMMPQRAEQLTDQLLRVEVVFHHQNVQTGVVVGRGRRG